MAWTKEVIQAVVAPISFTFIATPPSQVRELIV